MKIAAMISGGKDSLFAAYKVNHENELVCLITIKSDNPSSYMFHTPNIDLVELQAKSMNIPLITQKTKGEKEIELSDLKKAFLKAKNKYNIEGVVTGALFSNYQKERIEKLCDELKLTMLSPLWHMDQEEEMRMLLREGFKITLSSVAALGFDSSWLGRIITERDVDKLVELNKRYHINIAGEGGEYESLVLDCPLFKKALKILDSKIVKEDSNTASMLIEKAELIDK